MIKYIIGPKEIKNFFYSGEWKQIKEWCLKAYGGKCCSCKTTENVLLRHIKSIHTHPQLSLYFFNVHYLCDACNKSFKSEKVEPEFVPSERDIRVVAVRYSKYFRFELDNPVNHHATDEQRFFLRRNKIKHHGDLNKAKAAKLIKEFKEKQVVRSRPKVKVKKESSSPKIILRKRINPITS